MKLAIHKNKGSFSERWIVFCERNNIKYKIVDCYSSNIIEELHDCEALLWNWNNTDHKAMLFARQLIYSIEQEGKQVFPNAKTCWHYDDKIGQKYLLESLSLPFIKTDIFYDQESAREWISKATFPKVFKLSGGAGASNVKLVNDKAEAYKLLKKSFGRGFPAVNRISKLKDYYNAWKRNKTLETFIIFMRSIVRVFIPSTFEKIKGRERGYIYFQEFIPNNDFDIRIITVGNKAFGIKRMTRDGDFRASGSGLILYDKKEIDERCVQIAFEASKAMETQCTAYDFVFDKNNNPLIIEISYAFLMTAYDKCEGYWDDSLTWHSGEFNPENWMIENIIENIKLGKKRVD
jgi:glutathione synthase/RimK-type ligase-like ATP-grasp enzyme